MNGRGGCCIARYVGPPHDMSKVDRIMLRFRPIAPKPAVSSGSRSGSADSAPDKSEVAAGRTGRGKRRPPCVKDCSSGTTKRCNTRRRKAAASVDDQSATNDVVSRSAVTTTTTLPLLPETPDCCGKRDAGRNAAPVWLSFESAVVKRNDDGKEVEESVVDRPPPAVVVAVPQAVRMVASCVTVERVAEAWGEGKALGWTDEERRRNLERDTCPGFISDGGGRVTWTNGAYREMVGTGTAEEAVRVWLEMKETAEERWPAFTCRVKVQYRRRWGKERSSLTVPCDAWRMDDGGFAWRLDLKAALSLGFAR